MNPKNYIPYEKQYLDNVRNILSFGTPCDAERTGTGTRMLTGLGYRVDLSKEFPILTTKAMPFDKIVAENIWFVSGSTSNDDLLELGAKFWTGWEDEAGQLGPLYGAMWRRRPVSQVRYEELAPVTGYYSDHRVITKNYVKTNCRKTPNLQGFVSDICKQRYAQIHALWYEMMANAAAEGATVQDSWLAVDGFVKDFPRIAGNELLHMAAVQKHEALPVKKLVVVNYQTPHNAYNIDTVCVVPAYLAAEYPRKELKSETYSSTYLCPIFYIDQLANALEQLQDHSQSRRIVIDCWDPSLLPVEDISPSLQPLTGLQSLAPCHPLWQLNVVPSSNGKPARLDVCVYMRSQDKFLGTPFNMAGYAVMAHMLAAMSDLEPGILTMTGGNCHVYADHINQVKSQLRRKPRGMVKLAPLPRKANIEDYTFDDFKLVNYRPASAIKAKASI